MIKSVLFLGLFCQGILMVATAAEADWKQGANERIRETRQRDIHIRVVDESGKAVANARIELKQIRQAFPFGAAMSSQILRNEAYRAFFKAHFNWAAFENESKWYSNERRANRPNYQQADAMAEWCKENGIPLRGHCLFWAPERWAMNWLKALDPNALRAAVDRRIESAVPHFQGTFLQWDVNNEMLHGSFFKDRLGEQIHPWMFKRTRELDPNAQLYVNEFNILSVDKDFTQVQLEEYLTHIRWLQAQGAPIDGIGIQGHVWNADLLATPHIVKERLDRLASLNLPIWITEYDCAQENAEENANILELVYRSAYSHPAVEGIIMWVFWAGNSWRGPHAGLAHEDWTLSAAGERYDSLMAEWQTHVTGHSDAEGRFLTRAYHGEYEVTARAEGFQDHADTFDIRQGNAAQEAVIVLKR